MPSLEGGSSGLQFFVDSSPTSSSVVFSFFGFLLQVSEGWSMEELGHETNVGCSFRRSIFGARKSRYTVPQSNSIKSSSADVDGQMNEVNYLLMCLRASSTKVQLLPALALPRT